MAQTELPIACTLGPADGRDRMERWRALHEQARPTATRDEHRLDVPVLTVTAPADEPTALDAIAALLTG